MNVELRDRSHIPPAGISGLAIADCDIQQSPKPDMKGIYPYLHWRDHLDALYRA